MLKYASIIIAVIVLFRVNHHSSAINVPTAMLNVPIAVTAVVQGVPTQFHCLTKFNAQLLAVNHEPLPKVFPAQLPMSLYDCHQTIHANEVLSMTVKLKVVGRPPHAHLIGSVDAKQPIHVQGYGHDWLSHWRESFYLKIQQVVGDTNVASLVAALTLGIKNTDFYQLAPVFSATGTSHLFAISGLHVGLVACVCLMIVRVVIAAPLFVFQLERWFYPVCLVVTFCCILGYCLLSGLSSPTRRAVIMGGIFCLSLLLKRSLSLMTVFMLSLLCFVLIDADGLLHLSAILSFLAVGSLVLASDWLGIASGKIQPLLRLQWVLLLGLLPVTLFVFHQWVLLAPVINFFVVPLVACVILPLSCCIVCFPKSLAILLSQWLLAPIVRLLLSVLTVVAHWPWARWSLRFTWWQAVLMTVIAVFLFLPLGRLPKLWCLLLLLLIISIGQPFLPSGEVKMAMVDVGQGLSVFVQTAHHSLLYDTGPRFYTGGDMMQKHVLPFLRQKGVNHLDALVISHGDDDHIGGYQRLLDNYRINAVYTSATKRLPRATPCLAGAHWVWDGVSFTFLYPSPAFVGLGNNSSCVLKIDSVHQSALLTGDIERLAEDYLRHTQSHQLPADIMQVPHHGSSTSSSLAFIAAVQPRQAWFSAGKGNRYGVPTDDVVSRYLSAGAITRFTTEEAAIIATLH